MTSLVDHGNEVDTVNIAFTNTFANVFFGILIDNRAKSCQKSWTLLTGSNRCVSMVPHDECDASGLNSRLHIVEQLTSDLDKGLKNVII